MANSRSFNFERFMPNFWKATLSETLGTEGTFSLLWVYLLSITTGRHTKQWEDGQTKMRSEEERTVSEIEEREEIRKDKVKDRKGKKHARTWRARNKVTRKNFVIFDV